MSGYNSLFDSGGFLIEIGELAEIVKMHLGAKSIHRSLDESLSPDLYVPDNETYSWLQANLVIESEASLDSLVSLTIASHKEQSILGLNANNRSEG
jgi:hypothetical protein